MDSVGLPEKVRKKRETNDPTPEQFWSNIKEFEKICKVKADHPSWGAKTMKDEIGLQYHPQSQGNFTKVC